MSGRYFGHDFIGVLEKLESSLRIPCVSYFDNVSLVTTLSCSLKAEMSKSNVRSLLDSEEQPWQSTTNFAMREIGEVYLRSNSDILHVNVRNPFRGKYTKMIFHKNRLTLEQSY